MGSIVGEEVERYVGNQIDARQILHGSGKSTTRNNNQLKILNTQNSWIKLASGVKITKEKATQLGYPDLLGTELAKKYILFNGTSSFYKDGKALAQRGKFLPGTYERSDFGIVPMPGIESLTVKTLNRGSLKKATLKFKVHSRKQFEIIDVLYLRLGYTVLVEWGNNIYTKKGTDLHTVNSTLLEDSFFNTGEDGLENKKDYSSALRLVENKRAEYSGNYDGFLAKISNFEWVFNDDGSYSITLTLISLGDVIESLKSNISLSPALVKFQSYTDSSSQGDNKQEIQNRSKSQLHAFLWAWEWLNTHDKRDKFNKDEFVTNNGNRTVGYFLKQGDETISVTQYTCWWRLWYCYGKDVSHDTPKYTYTAQEFEGPKMNADRDKEMWNHIAAVGRSRGWDDFREEADDDLNSKWDTWKLFYSSTTNTTNNPIEFMGGKDGFRTAHADSGRPNCYIRFGALLRYINEKLVPRINLDEEIIEDPSKLNKLQHQSLTPLFNINIENGINSNSIMYTIPNHQSCDMKICCIKQTYAWPLDITDNDGDTHKKGNYYNYFQELEPFRTLDFDASKSPGGTKKFKHVNRAQALNIYLNFDFVREVLDTNTDKDGNVSVFSLIKGICDGVNRAMGGINNLEPIISEENNTLNIIDTTPIPGRVKLSGKYVLNLFGYNGNTSNFVRKLNIKTAITPEYATMITVGATAGGNIKGTDATAFAKWNYGIEDKFKPSLVSGDVKSANAFPADPVSNYTEKILKDWTASRLCTADNAPYTSANRWQDGWSQDTIDQNLSLIPEFYKYAIARKNQLSSGGDSVSGGIGFIPFKIQLTLDGIAGVKIYNVLHIDSSFLPSVYGTSLDFIVTGISHKLSKNDWETDLEVTVMPKSDLKTGVIENYDYLWNEVVSKALEAAAAASTSSGSTSSVTTSSNTAPQNTSTPTRNPEKAKGTLGTVGDSSAFVSGLAPGALSLIELANTVIRSGTTNPLRKRIVAIAASYVGQDELPGENQGWHDQRFEDKIKKPNVTEKGWGWFKPEPWCAWFVSRVMYEAHVVGNALLDEADDKFKSIWKNRYNDGANTKPFSAGVATTEAYFKNTLKRDVRRAKAIKNPDLIQPGDIVYYNISHIGIVVKVNKDAKGKLKSLDIVNGNTSAKATTTKQLRDGGTTALKRNYSINNVRGFSRLFES